MMGSSFFLFAAAMLAGAFISSLAQVLLRGAAEDSHDSLLTEYLNLKVLVAYLLFLVASFLGICGYTVVPLSVGTVLDATGYFWVTIFGATIFKEKIGGMKICALLLIIGGTVVFSLFG